MKIRGYIYMILISFCLSSCLKAFDLDLEDEPIIYLESFPGTESNSVSFWVEPGYSRSNTALTPDFKPEITFTVNGQEVPVQPVIVNSVVSENSYIAYHSPQPGDKMSIQVASEGFKTVYAETTIPELFPDRRIDYYTADNGTRQINMISVTLDEAKGEYAYGLQILNEYSVMHPTDSYTRIYRSAGVDMYLDYDMAASTMQGIDIRIEGDYLSAWDGKIFDGNKAVMLLMPPTYGYGSYESYEEFFPEEGESIIYDEYGNETGVYKYTDRNKLVLYTMTQEFYKYKVAQELVIDNASMFAGLAPVNFCYSNITNGYGAFAGVSIVETDWITREFIENNR